ncbi:hypothetical protein KNP414_07298 [Paenibacillus mucilaginosus KNP414]|uniref:Uncharacterized protein n=1 Tax=Paenibacillus mucilaginosus (strain KNP414) TaxID=1036673 RepID=F8FP29_PAEMK|nr:hypothetical protein KNP414_07298 [Paenibacillus mucilaginosus KNP414]
MFPCRHLPGTQFPLASNKGSRYTEDMPGPYLPQEGGPSI